MNMTFLFWNTYGKKCLTEIQNLVNKYDVDVLALSENIASEAEVLLKLNKNTSDFYPNHPRSNCSKIKVYTKFHYDYIQPIVESHRITIRKINVPLLNDALNFICVHLGDKSSFNSESQSEMASELRQQIIDMEKITGHSRTFILGDFNMNPFEIGMVKANGLHATMSQRIATQIKRKVQTTDYDYFYNPMWSMYGDLNKSISGTYYYRRAELVSYQWNIFDQVLIRPILIPNFCKDSLEIVSNDGSKDLIASNGIPNKDLYSDHLPIIFRFKF